MENTWVFTGPVEIAELCVFGADRRTPNDNKDGLVDSVLHGYALIDPVLVAQAGDSLHATVSYVVKTEW